MYIFEIAAYHRHYMPYCWFLICVLVYHAVYPFHLVLDPAGDFKNPGRQLATCYERSVTSQLCEAVKKRIADEYPHITVTITRTAGEACTQKQRAQIANQLMADLFIHISCFEQAALKPTLTFYFYDDPMQQMPYVQTPYALVPVHKAHLVSETKTGAMVGTLCLQLHKQSLYVVQGPYGIPDARLRGLWVPACTLEFGISRTVLWTSLLDPLEHAIVALLKQVIAP